MNDSLKEKGILTDKQGFSKLFDEYYPALCAFANNYLKNHEIAEDLVQEVFVSLWSKKDILKDIFSIKSFLYTLVKNKCINELKHLKIKEKHIVESEKEEDNFFTDHIIEEETHRLIYNAINELPPKCKEIVLLSLNGIKNHEIAEELDISVNTVKTQKKIAYNQLRIKLQSLLAISPFFIKFL